jgi:hypothetical protein
MALQDLLLWWGLFLVSNVLLGASIGMLVKGGPFRKVSVPPAAATFVLVCGLTLMLFAGKQNLLQATINFLTGG